MSGETMSHVVAPPAPGRRFASADPAELGFDRAALAGAVRFASGLRSSSVRVYRHGRLAARSTRDPVTERFPQALASSSKGVLSLVIGRAITLGAFELDDPIGTFFPEADAAHGAITVRQLLNQTSGLQFSWGADLVGLATDAVAQALSLPFAHEPGTVYEYAQTTLSLLGVIVERTTGIDFQRFAHEELFTRVGIPRGHWLWLRDRRSRTITMGGLLLRPDDQARMGELMLRNGRWDSEQVISSDYVRQAVTGTSANPGNGFLFWLNEGDTYKIASLPTARMLQHPLLPGTPRDAFAFCGALGQIIVVVPSRDMVVVRNGLPSRFDRSDPIKYSSATTSPDLKELVRRIVASVDDLPQNTDPGPYTYDDGRYFDVAGNRSVWYDRQLVRAALRDQPGASSFLHRHRSLPGDMAKQSIDLASQLAMVLRASARG